MIFFDLDGTLLESNGLWLNIDQRFLKARGITEVPEDYIEYVSNHVAPSGAKYTKERFGFPESAEEILAEWQAMASQAYREELPLRKGAKELLQALHKQGTPMSIVTACIPELCHLAINRHEIGGYFTHIHTAIDLGIDKRDKRLFSMVAEREGKRPEECILVDDAIDYCTAAKESGFTVFGIHDPHTKQEERSLDQICDLFVEDLTYITAEMVAKKLKELEGAKPVATV